MEAGHGLNLEHVRRQIATVAADHKAARTAAERDGGQAKIHAGRALVLEGLAQIARGNGVGGLYADGLDRDRKGHTAQEAEFLASVQTWTRRAERLAVELGRLRFIITLDAGERREGLARLGYWEERAKGLRRQAELVRLAGTVDGNAAALEAEAGQIERRVAQWKRGE
jgi:hypothetical protein